jgi:ergothioneine biosynthesis protein EgtB
MTDRDRYAALEWFRRNRARSRALFITVAPDAFLERPIALRHPVAFYEGHLPAFNYNTLLRRGLHRAPLDAELDVLFERGIDPLDEGTVAACGRSAWPERARVQAYADAADRAVADAIQHGDIDRDDDPVLRGGLALYSILEHEAMHHETLLYMLHQLPYAQKRAPQGPPVAPAGASSPAPAAARVRIPAGVATLGADPTAVRFVWDNELPPHRVTVPAFEIDTLNVTNADYLAFVEAGGYALPEYWDAEGWTWRTRHGIQHPAFWARHDGAWWWRGLFAEVPLPASSPVWVSHAEASAYARWRGRRLPTEAELQRAAFGTPEGRERLHPWGDEPPDATRGRFWDDADVRDRAGGVVLPSFEPASVGAFPVGASAFGIHDLAGNGWEWTSTVFAGFDGFIPSAAYPGYSADFFDGRHYVMKGASPATATVFLRRSWRNWFQPHYPYPYVGFRLAA